MPDARPRVLAVLPALFPSTVIGVAKPLLRLHQDGDIALRLTLQYLVSRRAVDGADVLVLCHTIDPQCGWLLDAARDRGLPIVYEIDDDLLDVPPDIPGLDYLRRPEWRAMIERCLRQAAVVRVYSTALQKKLGAYNDAVSLVSGPLDWGLVPDEAPWRDDGRVRLVYATSRLDDTIGRMLIEPLGEVLRRFDEVDVTIWGPRHEALVGRPRVRFLPLVRDYDAFFARFAREGFDIGLAPLPDDAFHRGKSNNKFREYGACGIAGVYSDVSVYRECVVNGETGLLAPNDPAAWVEAVSRLVADGALRRRLGGAAHHYARVHYNERFTDGQWLSAIHRLASRPRVPAPAGTMAGPHAGRAPLVGHLGRLARKAGPVLREHGLGTMLRRTWTHVHGFAQALSWGVKRHRLQRRVVGQRGRS